MMRKKNCAALLLSMLLGFFVQAQLGETTSYSHHIGVQVNPLLRQIVNFGNSPAIDNPFLLKYGLRNNARQTEWMVGFGYRYALQNREDGLKSDLSDLDFRVGYAKKYNLSNRFEVGVGLDLVLNLQNNQTVNVQTFGGGLDSTVSTTQSQDFAYGAGPQVTFAYYLTSNIKIGTETTFYFLRGSSNLLSRVENWRRDFNGNQIYSSSTDEFSETTMDLSFQLPVALFLTVIF
jgi:hypothetical protein